MIEREQQKSLRREVFIYEGLSFPTQRSPLWLDAGHSDTPHHRKMFHKREIRFPLHTSFHFETPPKGFSKVAGRSTSQSKSAHKYPLILFSQTIHFSKV
jgi:hypothetical protein